MISVTVLQGRGVDDSFPGPANNMRSQDEVGTKDPTLETERFNTVDDRAFWRVINLTA